MLKVAIKIISPDKSEQEKENRKINNKHYFFAPASISNLTISGFPCADVYIKKLK